MIIIVLIAALLGVLILAFGPKRRKQYNEFRCPAATASTPAAYIYGDTGAGGISGGCGGDGGSGAC